MRVAILGLYNSGSSLLSSMMLDLGFNIGVNPSQFFEPPWLSEQLRQWWSETREPILTARVAQAERVRVLREWVIQRERENPLVAVKHPLLCLSASDIEAAWGPETRYLRCVRPLETSIARLAKRRWYPGQETRMQSRLYDALEGFFKEREHLPIQHDDVIANPRAVLEQIISWLGLELSDEKLRRAISRVRTNK